MISTSDSCGVSNSDCISYLSPSDFPLFVWWSKSAITDACEAKPPCPSDDGPLNFQQHGPEMYPCPLGGPAPVEVFVRGVPTDSLRREEPEAKSYVQQRKGVTRADLGSFRGQKHTSGAHKCFVSNRKRIS